MTWKDEGYVWAGMTRLLSQKLLTAEIGEKSAVRGEDPKALNRKVR